MIAWRPKLLQYGDISLVPVENRDDWWHIPGGKIATTNNLMALANKRGITLRLTESSCDGQTTTRLN